MQKQIHLRPNYQVVRQLMKTHIQVSDFVSDMEIQGVYFYRLRGIDLFKIVLDLIGFPPGEDDVSAEESEGSASSITYDREKWDEKHFPLEVEEIDQFLEKVYADYDNFLLKQQKRAVTKQ